MAKRHDRTESKSPPEHRRKTAEANLARGQAFRFKPGQSGNPGGRPRTAKLSEACRAKLASPIPGDPESRSFADVIADKLALQALKGDIRAAQEISRPSRRKAEPDGSSRRAEWREVYNFGYAAAASTSGRRVETAFAVT